MMSHARAKTTTRIVVVHDNREFLAHTVNALRDAGHDTATSSDTMSAPDTLDAESPYEVLITRMQFPRGQLHGVSLSLMVRNKSTGIKVLLAAAVETQVSTQGLGEFLPTPVDADEIVIAGDRMRRGGSCQFSELAVGGL